MPEEQIDYGQTIHLPKTDFSRRGGLPKKEPSIVKRWQEMDLYNKQRQISKGKEKKILHMGPPFANGHIHMGHALSTVLKDVVTRSWQGLGYDAPLVPGFDCHGLPIEWKIEEKYQEAGIDKDNIPPEDFIRECRDFANKWISVQTEEFQRLGVFGDWDNPYKTMDNRSEAFIVKQVHKFVMSDSVYRGSKPVMWAVPEQCSLAEAEIEYRDHTSDTVWVKFPVKTGADEFLSASIVIWTTTPWTLPGNRAVAYGADMDYIGLEVKSIDEESVAIIGDKLLIAKDLLENFLNDTKITDHAIWWEGKGSEFSGVICRHCLHEKGYNFDVPALEADFVTTETGTGFVHIAPGHGEDDYKLGLKNGVEIPATVEGDGTYSDNVPEFAGIAVYTKDGKKGAANKMVTLAIQELGRLVARGHIRHSYPHSWRSKSPVIYRNTPQWFISVDKNDLRKKALAEIKKVKWHPERAEKRLSSMVENRGDWCISRARSWGVPLAIFVNKKTGEILRDEAVFDRIFKAFEAEGAVAWHVHDAEFFLGANYNADEWDKEKDIIDVWFESGSTQDYVLKERPELHWPADLYLEGSDQHRGWFQSSLMVSCGTWGTAPYKSVLTHGFILDEKGYKMAKSGKNGLSPLELSEELGADIVRLWVVGSDYTDDIRFGKNVLRGHTDVYRRIRNTFCYLLGNLSDFSKSNSIEVNNMPEIDRWVMHRLYEMDCEVRKHIENFDFQKMIAALHNFCAKDLSAFYFDINKDNLYCNAQDSFERRSAQTVLDKVFMHLCHWLAPILCFTVEEAWASRNGESLDSFNDSIHLQTMPDAPKEWKNDALATKWAAIQDIKRVVTGAIEIKRANKEIRSSLEAEPTLYVEDAQIAETLNSINFADICIVSSIKVLTEKAPDDAFRQEDMAGIAVSVAISKDQKCARCWKYTDDIGADSSHTDICVRCADSIKAEKLVA